MINFNEKTFLRELQYLVNVDSGIHCVDGLEKIADFFVEKYTSMGMSVEKKTFDPLYGPCVEARSHKEEEVIDLLLICHMDTVFPEGTTVKRPFYTVGDKAYGPGVADMKSGCLLASVLTEQLLKERPNLRICVVLNCDNEVGSLSSRGWLWELAKNSRYCLGFEVGRPDGSFVKKRKGAAYYSIKMYGKSAHAGIDPRGGASAVIEMANWICRFADFDRLPLETSLNFGVVNAGTMYNIIPDYAEGRVDIRFQTEEDLETIVEEIQDLCRCPYNPEIRVVAEMISKSFPMMENEGSEYLMKLMEEEGERLEMDVHFSGSGGVSDASIASVAGAGAIDACGPIGFHTHNEKECILISSIQPRLELLLAVCKRL